MNDSIINYMYVYKLRQRMEQAREIVQENMEYRARELQLELGDKVLVLLYYPPTTRSC